MMKKYTLIIALCFASCDSFTFNQDSPPLIEEEPIKIVSPEILLDPNYIPRIYFWTYSPGENSSYIAIMGADGASINDGSHRRGITDFASYLSNHRNLVAKYDGNCLGLSNEGIKEVACWDKRYISIFDIPMHQRAMLKIIDNSNNTSELYKKFRLSVTEGISLGNGFYIYRDPRTAPNYKYQLHSYLRLFFENVNFPILIDKVAIAQLTT